MKSKKIITIAALIFIIFKVTGCSKNYTGPPAELVIKNAKIVTIDKNNSRAQAVAISGEFIIGVGSDNWY